MIAPFLFVALTHGYSLKEGVTPVQKVIQMLQEMSAKGAAEKAAEEKTFIQYKEFCNTETAAKTAAIEKGGEEIEMLIADIQKAMSDSSVCAKKIMEEEALLGKLNAAMAESNAVSEKDRADYLKEHADYSESVDSLARGIQQFQSGIPAGLVQEDRLVQSARFEALIQLQRLSKMPVHAKRVLASFLELKEDPDFFKDESADALAVSAPESGAYAAQTGGIVDMLKKLLTKFKDELYTLEQEEMKRKGAQEVVIQDLKRQIEAATESKTYETTTKAERDRTAAEKKGLLADTQKAKADDEDYLATLKSECAMAAEDFENRQQLRVEEMEAIEKATEILKSGSVLGNSEKHLPGFMQKAAHTKRAFPLRGARGLNPTTQDIQRFLENKAAQTGSKLLGLVAQKVDAAAQSKIPGFDPISQVKKMMQDMIVQLMEQANEEASAKLWCDTELSSNKQTRDTKTDGVNELNTEKDKLSADIAKLGEEIKELTQAIAEIDAAVSEATLTRMEEKETNKETIADAAEAQTAVSQALTVLKEFYRKAATATAFVQVKDEPAKNPFQEPYTGQQGESTGVVGMLEVIGSDFARLESETEAAESQAAKEFERFSIASAKDKSVKNQEMQDRINLQITKKAGLTDTEGDLKAMQEELDSALLYYDKLKPSCVDAGSKYAERVQRRQDEIKSLEECLRFFEGNDLPPMEE